MPYMLVKEGDKICVYKHDENHHPVGSSHGCHDTHDEAVAQMRALYAAEGQKSLEAVALLDNIMESAQLAKDRNVGGGVDRNKIPKSHFVFPEDAPDGGFPIMIAKDVEDAVSNWGHYKGKRTFEEFKKRLTAIANELGFHDALPESWKKKKSDELAELLVATIAKSVYDSATSDYVWTGVSHNAWVDDAEDIIPLHLIEADIAWQKSKIDSGEWKQFGQGLWIDHHEPAVGDCLIREVIEGGRSCFEGGNLKSEYAKLNGSQMSIGYNYLLAGGEYALVYVKERSALEKTHRVNGRTFFSVKKRQLLNDAALKSVAEDISAFLEGYNG